MGTSSDEDEEKQESTRVLALVSLALVTGVVLVGVSYHAINSEALYEVDRLVRYNTEYEATLPVITTWRIFQILFGVGILVVVAGVIGAVGAVTRNKGLVCTYVTLGGVLSFVMIVAAISALLRRSMIEPIIDRQVTDMCDPETYVRLSMNMPCPWASDYNQSIPACGAIACQPKVERLKSLGENEGGGCWLMPRLCKAFEYTELSAAECAEKIEGANGTWYKGGLTLAPDSASCAKFCNEDIACTSYVFVQAAAGSSCFLTNGMDSKSVETGYRTPIAGAMAKTELLSSAEGKQCFDRSTPEVVENFKTQGLRMAVTTMLLGILLTASVVITFVLMYNVNVKRPGKPKGNDLVMMLCCPCMARTTHKRLQQELAAKDEELAGSSDNG